VAEVSTQQLPAQAPDFTLDHVLGHSVSLGDFRGRTLVVVFGGRESAPQLKAGIHAIRMSRGPDDLPVIGISDLRAAPRPARILVKSQLKKAYQEAVQDETATLAAAGKPPMSDPTRDVIMLMDWSGEVVGGFGLSGVDKEAVGVVVDGDGKILGAGHGAQLGEQVLAILSA
jgi:hypothetical protein